jgi:hypothetical protein
MRWCVLISVMWCVACARQPGGDMTRPPEAWFRAMPNPDGCYLQVWDGPQYTGQFDYINGPRSYPTLRSMANQRNWQRRIASVRVGPTAMATAFREENFQGSAFEFAARAQFSTLPEIMARRISSLRIQCGETTSGSK